MQKEAERENGFAMHDMGKMILSGLGCEADENPFALYLLGVLYHRGQGWNRMRKKPLLI